jgi:hypothetical protein
VPCTSHAGSAPICLCLPDVDPRLTHQPRCMPPCFASTMCYTNNKFKNIAPKPPTSTAQLHEKQVFDCTCQGPCLRTLGRYTLQPGNAFPRVYAPLAGIASSSRESLPWVGNAPVGMISPKRQCLLGGVYPAQGSLASLRKHSLHKQAMPPWIRYTLHQRDTYSIKHVVF